MIHCLHTYGTSFPTRPAPPKNTIDPMTGEDTKEQSRSDDIPNDFPMVESPAAADDPSEKFGVPSNGIVS